MGAIGGEFTGMERLRDNECRRCNGTDRYEGRQCLCGGEICRWEVLDDGESKA